MYAPACVWLRGRCASGCAARGRQGEPSHATHVHLRLQYMHSSSQTAKCYNGVVFQSLHVRAYRNTFKAQSTECRESGSYDTIVYSKKSRFDSNKRKVKRCGQESQLLIFIIISLLPEDLRFHRSLVRHKNNQLRRVAHKSQQLRSFKAPERCDHQALPRSANL